MSIKIHISGSGDVIELFRESEISIKDLQNCISYDNFSIDWHQWQTDIP